MPTPLLPVELEALIEQNITDDLNQQNTAQRVREVLLYMVASMGLPATPGGPVNPDYAALMAELAKKADKKAVETALGQKEQAFKPFAPSELKAVEYAYSNLALRPLLKQLISAVAAGGGGGGSTTFDITPAVSDGDIQAGVTYTGVTSEDLWRLKLEPYAKPGFSSFTIANQGTRTLLVGSTVSAGFKSIGWATVNSGNINPNSLKLQDITAGTTLLDNEANDGTASASTAGFTVALGESRRYRLSGTNSQGGSFSADLAIFGAHETYLGASTSPSLTPAQIVALGGAQLQGDRSRTATGVTTSGGQYLYYAYPAAFGDLTSIILDGAAPVLGAFQKLGDFQVTNNAGAGLTVRLYRSNATNAFTNNSLAFA